MRLSQRVARISISSTAEVFAAASKLKSQGIDLVDLGAGEPDFPTPENIKQVAIQSIHKNFTRYTPTDGISELKEAIVYRHREDFQSNYTPEEVLVTSGGKHAIFNLISALIDPGDEVVIPSPYWVTFREAVSYAGGSCKFVRTAESENFRLTALQIKTALSEKTRLILLNSPNNPSGTTHNNLEALALIAKKNNIIVLSDEIYAELDFSGKYKSMSHYYPEGTIISSGLSKWCGAGGWRIGSLTFPKELKFIKNMVRNVASETFTAVSAPIQYASIKAYSEDHSQYLINSRKILEFISNYILHELIEVGIKCQKPQGGFYMLCDFSNAIKQSNEISDGKSLCNKILNEVGFAMLPGSDFGIQNELLISRIAFVDFDGGKALKLMGKDNEIPNDFLQLACPKIIKGIKKLKNWIKKN